MAPRSKIPPNIHNTQLLRSMERRRGIRARTISETRSSTSEPLVNRSTEASGHMAQDRGGHMSEPVTHRDPGIPPPEDIMAPSTDLSWHPKIQRFWWRIRGGWRSYWKAIFQKPTPEQLEAKAFEKQEKQNDRIAKREGRKYIYGVKEALLQLGQADRRDRLINQRWRVTGFARNLEFTQIILCFDKENLPSYISVEKLKHDIRFTSHLGMVIHREVHWSIGEWGYLLVIDRPVEEKPKPRKITVEDLIKD